MCGLVSLIARQLSGFYAQDMDLFENMLLLDQLRGKDSAGAMTTFRNGDQKLIKHATKHVSLLFETKEWRDLRGKVIATGRHIVGHNRAATRGKHTSENAHPFNAGKISLVHNGTIWNQKELAPKDKVEVDSNSIAIALDSAPIKEVIPEISGAFALIWYNNDDEKLYAVRNDERPLHLVTTDDHYSLISEPWMMACLWNRQQGRRKILDIREVKPGELLSFDLKGNLESSEVSLRAKKAQTYTGSTTTTQSGRAATSVSQSATRGAVEDNMEDPIPPFPLSPTQVGQPGSMQHIRQTLTQAAQAREERERSTSCALTQGVDTASTITTRSASNESSTAGVLDDVARYNEGQAVQQRNIIVQNADFKPGDFTLLKIYKTFVVGKFVRFAAKITMPGKPMLDAVGVLPDGLQPADWSGYMEHMCTGHVKFATYTTGGPSIYVEKILKAGYTDVHGEDVPWVYWNKALVSGCSKCAGKLFDWERPYTVVRARGDCQRGGMVAALRCVCPDCLMKELPSGDIYDTYAKRYNEAKQKHLARCNAEGRNPPPRRDSSVQDGQSVSTESSGTTNAVIVVPGSQTLQ